MSPSPPSPVALASASAVKTAPLDRPLVAALNHLLAQSDWARRRLAPHAGKRVHLRTGGVECVLAIDEPGLLRVAPAGEADLVLEAPLLALPAVRAGDPSARQAMRATGDAALAADLAEVAAHLRWDIEADLARVVGDIAAHRIARTLESLARLPADAAATLARSAGRYATAEQALVPDRARLEAWAESVDRLREDVDRLEARVGLLETDRGR